MEQIVVPVRPLSIAVVGGGFTGSLFALKMAAAQPGWTISLIERRPHGGRGLAYGACGPEHLLNVPVHRMEVGLQPTFADWVRPRMERLKDALEESKGSLRDAFVPRQLYGDYMQQCLADSLRARNVRYVRDEAVRIDRVSHHVVLANSKALAADVVVLAVGNPPPSLPFDSPPSRRIVADPWQPGVLDHIQRDSSLLLVGTGLTMVDTLFALQARAHRGPVHAISRHGLLPRSHGAGGNWPGFLNPAASPRQALRAVRASIQAAEDRGIPWQRVFDAVRPVAATLWHGWTIGQRAQFLRHLRTLWDMHRHRMAARAADAVDNLLWSGALTVTAGRVLAVDEHKDGLTVVVRPRGERALALEVDTILNCTGPDLDMRRARNPLMRCLIREGIIRSDPLGLGLDTRDCAVIGADGEPSNWLFALGPPTRPAWWEITAVPEIAVQIDRLVQRLTRADSRTTRPLAEAFLDIGAGI